MLFKANVAQLRVGSWCDIGQLSGAIANEYLALIVGASAVNIQQPRLVGIVETILRTSEYITATEHSI